MNNSDPVKSRIFVSLKKGPKTVGPPVHQRAKQRDAKLKMCAALWSSTGLLDEDRTRPHPHNHQQRGLGIP